MKRSNFLKSLAVAIVSPKVVIEVAKNTDIVPAPPLVGGSFRDMQLLLPSYYNSLVEKYGDINYTELMEQIGKHGTETMQSVCWYEKPVVNQSIKTT